MKWMSVHDGLPANSRAVDCFVDGERWPNCYHEHENWYDFDVHIKIDGVTHWMEIPEPPEVD